MKKYLMIMVCATAMVTGCYNDNEEELYPKTSSNNCDLTNTTYSATVSGIIGANCAISGCHVAGGQTPDLSTYNGLKNNIDRVKVRAIDEKSMPAAGPLSKCDLDKLQKWIDNGALNN